ncbi:hypothetical protein DV515_00006709 [Chloebia gouldiae]|uniref:Uncharacterized protein n=1 Tax=Chloebia gouldiae TaxID=44316 RepID=A0A3L8SKH2_CHLGU|nr:hypothetical protein DV515_00006709 [Chloebia gouldiae]
MLLTRRKFPILQLRRNICSSPGLQRGETGSDGKEEKSCPWSSRLEKATGVTAQEAATEFCSPQQSSDITFLEQKFLTEDSS